MTHKQTKKIKKCMYIFDVHTIKKIKVIVIVIVRIFRIVIVIVRIFRIVIVIVDLRGNYLSLAVICQQ